MKKLKETGKNLRETGKTQKRNEENWKNQT